MLNVMLSPRTILTLIVFAIVGLGMIGTASAHPAPGAHQHQKSAPPPP